jgi:hypothetical protein
VFDDFPGNDGCRNLTTEYNKFSFFHTVYEIKFLFYLFLGGGIGKHDSQRAVAHTVFYVSFV